MSKKQKILVCGDVEGNFKTLFSRVNAINEKSGPFDFLFCVGDFFSDSQMKKFEPYKNGTLSVSVPTYILGPTKESHVSFYDDLSGCEICPNVNYLGRQGILFSNGLKIAYISGLEGSKKTDITFTEKEATTVRDAALKKSGSSQFLGVDILLSSEWPKDVTKFDKNFTSQETIKGSQTLAWLACQLKPRYHFSALHNIYYERPPYKNCPPEGTQGNSHSSRFISLAKVGNIAKNKWLYAANLTPLSEINERELYQSSTDETECPYAGLMKRKNSGSTSQFFYDMNAADDVVPKKKRKRNFSDSEKKKMNFDDPENCWFCLGSNCVEKHLVISIGEEVYVALAKGALTPYHVMIIPIKHHRCQTELSKTVSDEIKKYKSALKKFFKTKEQVPVFFERNFKTSHLQLHIVPVPMHVKERVKETFLNYAEDQGLKLSELPNKGRLNDFTQPGSPYFYVELPSKEKLFCVCHKNFPIHFGRDVLASSSVLNLPDRVNWRDCVKSKEEEEAMTKEFRSEFQVFDVS